MQLLQSILNYIAAFPYFLKSSLILCILYLAYFVYFSKGASFTANRFYLLSTIILTVFLPLISVDAFPILVKIATKTDSPTETISTSPIMWNNWIFYSLATLYLIGFLWMFSVLIFQLLKIIKFIQHAEKVNHGDHFQIISSSLPLSSFFHCVFIPTKTIDRILLDHELVHVRHLHTLDVLIGEIFKCIFWFHPLAYSLSNSIKLNHEFECDALMAERYSYESYGTLLIQHAQTKVKFSCINQFSSFTKKRIIMMSQQKNNLVSRKRHILMIPVLLSIFAFFSFRTYYVPIEGTAKVIKINYTFPPMNEEMDTIFTIDPVTLKESMKVVKSKKEEQQLDEANIIQNHPEIITYSDTSYILDPKTYKQSVKIENGKIVKGYKMLINNELRNKNPDFKKIEEWYKKGKQK